MHAQSAGAPYIGGKVESFRMTPRVACNDFSCRFFFLFFSNSISAALKHTLLLMYKRKYAAELGVLLRRQLFLMVIATFLLNYGGYLRREISDVIRSRFADKSL